MAVIDDLIRAGIPNALRGELEQEIAKSGSRLSPGGFLRAIARVIANRPGLTKYERSIIRNRIAPNVLDRFRIARRQRDPDAPAQRNVPRAPNRTGPNRSDDVFEYTVRGRQRGVLRSQGSDFVLVIRSNRPLTWPEILDLAIQAAMDNRFTLDYQDQVDPTIDFSMVSWAIIDVLRVPRRPSDDANPT